METQYSSPMTSIQGSPASRDSSQINRTGSPASSSQTKKTSGNSDMSVSQTKEVATSSRNDTREQAIPDIVTQVENVPFSDETENRTEASNMPMKKKKRKKKREDEDELVLKFGAKHVIAIYIPVCINMMVVIVTMSTSLFYNQKKAYTIYTPFHTDTEDVGTKVWQSVANAGIIVGVIIVMTCVMVVLYKYRCYKILTGWLIVGFVALLLMMSIMYVEQVLLNYNIPFDYITLCVIIWNWLVSGMICIHWKGPLLLQQTYLILISSLVSCFFIKYLPGWTVWALLSLLVIWDLVAVLCPGGPLRMLVELAQERDEPLMSALVYHSTMMWSITMTDSNASNSIKESSASKKPAEEDPENQEEVMNVDTLADIEVTPDMDSAIRPADEASIPRGDKIEQPEEEEEDHGVKLGLGDFIFYSILVGKVASEGDWNTTMACFIAILVGLGWTLLLLSVFKKALPALPISLTCGLIFKFGTSQMITPFLEVLQSDQIFI